LGQSQHLQSPVDQSIASVCFASAASAPTEFVLVSGPSETVAEGSDPGPGVSTASGLHVNTVLCTQWQEVVVA
jgi:hypothetical protein